MIKIVLNNRLKFIFMKNNLLNTVLTIFISGLVSAQTYPFQLPEHVVATLDVTTTIKEKANNKLLGVNIDWHKGYGNKGYNHPDAKSFIRKFNPVSLRWPQGVWANFYDWETDSRKRTDDYNNKEYTAQVENNQALRYGFEGFNELHNELQFDVLWTFNITYDSEEKSVARLKDRTAKGFKIKDVELGNEQFWGNQRSNRTATPEKYVESAIALSKALKAEQSDIQISIPISWRRQGSDGKIDHTEYNTILTKDKSYFDAITVHRYVHLDRNSPVVSDESFRGILNSRKTIKEDVDFCRTFAPGKKVWLTEWGVSCGYHAASYLGMADAYMYLFENQNIYDNAHWFQINNYNAFFKTEVGKNNSKTITKTGYGAVYDILKSVYAGSDILKSKMTTTQLTPGCDAVVGVSVFKNNKIEILVVNKTPKSVPFKITVDKKKTIKKFEMESLNFENLNEDKIFALDENPLKKIEGQTESIILPPYSISKISNLN